MEDQSFVILSGGGMQPGSQRNSSASDSSSLLPDSSPASSVSFAGTTHITHDTSRTKYHIDELSTFAQRLEQAAENIFPNRGRSRYKDVHVLLLRWQEDEMGVEYELDDLAATFRDSYGFDTETWLIPNHQPHLALMRKSFEMVQNFGNSDNLLIVYYAGHGGMNSSRQPLWTCNSERDSPSLQWYAIQTIFEQAESDALLLLDCCAAASSAPVDGHPNSVTETIAACGFETWAPQPGRHSFTNTLISVLEEWEDRPDFTAAMLHCEVLNRLRHEKPERRGRMKKFECRRTPVHILSTRNSKAGSVELCPRRKVEELPTLESKSPEGKEQVRDGVDIGANLPDTNPAGSQNTTDPVGSGNYDLNSLTKVLNDGMTAIPHVLISIAIEEDQSLDFEQCRRWLQQFPALATYAKVQGVYRSNSTLLLLSLPVVIWDWLPDDNACAFIAYVHSSNLLDPDAAKSVPQSEKTKLRTSSYIDSESKPLAAKPGYDIVKPQPATVQTKQAVSTHIKNGIKPSVAKSLDQTEVDRLTLVEKEIKEKNPLIAKLRHEAIVNDHLTKTLRFLKTARPEDNIDKQIFTNHILHVIALNRSDPKNSQILQSIAALLNWTDEQKEQAGLARSELLNVKQEIPPHATPLVAKLLKQKALLRGEEFPCDAVAIYDFERRDKNELPLEEGQEVWISYRHGQGWLVAENPKTQQRGLVPESYVRLLRDSKGGSGSLTPAQANGDPSLQVQHEASLKGNTETFAAALANDQPKIQDEGSRKAMFDRNLEAHMRITSHLHSTTPISSHTSPTPKQHQNNAPGTLSNNEVPSMTRSLSNSIQPGSESVDQGNSQIRNRNQPRGTDAFIPPGLKRSSSFRALNFDLPRPSSPEPDSSILKISGPSTESARENGKSQAFVWDIALARDQVHCPSLSASTKPDVPPMRDDKTTLPSLREDPVMALLNAGKAQRLLSSDDLSRTPSQSEPVTMQVQNPNDTDISRASSNRTNASLTTATTYSSNISRQNSFSSDHFFNSIEMVRDNSAASLSEDFDSGILTLNGDLFESPKLQNTTPSPKSSQAFTLPILKRFMSRNSGHSQSSSTTQNSQSSAQPGLRRIMSVKSASTSSTNNGRQASTELQAKRPVIHTPSSSSSTVQSVRLSTCESQSSLVAGSGGEEMEKSQPNESSSSSPSSRSIQRLQAQNNLVPLKPQDMDEPPFMTREQNSRIEISKRTYQRPKHDRVFCTKCSDYPEGFRGEHELRRHEDRSHKTIVMKWIVVEPTDGQDHPKPLFPLSQCKACSKQQKKYGAYYNAAAHLRRAHFKPKSKAGNSKSNPLSGERVGGKGGGDWPPMNELKLWMKEVEEPYGPVSGFTSQDAVETDEESLDCGGSNRDIRVNSNSKQHRRLS